MPERMRRVNEALREVLSEGVAELKDPRIGFATVTAVRITPDLRYGKVFVSVLGSPDEQEATMQGLESAKPHLRFELGRQMRVKYTPELTFELDHSPENAQRLEEVFRKLHGNEAE